mgnify:CR=1 FL=1
MKLNEVCAGCGLKCTKDLKTGTNSRGTALYADLSMGILPGVKFSCCGHGRSEGYFALENGGASKICTKPNAARKRLRTRPKEP